MSGGAATATAPQRNWRRAKQQRVATEARSSLGKRRCFSASQLSLFLLAAPTVPVFDEESLNTLADLDTMSGLYLYGSISPTVGGDGSERKQTICRHRFQAAYKVIIIKIRQKYMNLSVSARVGPRYCVGNNAKQSYKCYGR